MLGQRSTAPLVAKNFGGPDVPVGVMPFRYVFWSAMTPSARPDIATMDHTGNLSAGLSAMTIKAIFFDIDGTLVDSNDEHVIAWQQALVAIGAEFDRQTLHDQIGKGPDMLVPTLLPDVDDAGQKRLGEAQGAIFKANWLAGVKAFPKARELLEHVHRCGQRVVLASSASQAELEHYIDLLEVRAFLAASTSSDDVKNTKPAPDIFKAALGKLADVHADEVIVVGDTPYDVEAAKKSGMRAVAVRSGKFGDAALGDAGATAIYDDVAALLANYARSPLAES